MVLVGGAKAAQTFMALSDSRSDESSLCVGDDLAGGLAPYGGVEMQGRGGDAELLASMIKGQMVGPGSRLGGRPLKASRVLEGSLAVFQFEVFEDVHYCITVVGIMQGKDLCKPSDQQIFCSSKFPKLLTFPNYISLRRGVSKRVKDGRRPPALKASKRQRKRRLLCKRATPKPAVRLFQE
jgi:hypothetical protein